MTQGYYAGISGIQSSQFGMDVISDNLANISTTAYKGTTTEFADIFSKTLSSSGANTPTANDVGLGVKFQTTSFQFQQGAMMPSDRFNDLAIEGNGWFGVISNNRDLYTRDGHFSFETYQKVTGDANSSTARLVTADGMYVSGTMLSNYTYNAATGSYVITNPADTVALNSVSKQGILEFPTLLTYPVVPTSTTSFFGNLGFDNETRTMSADAISAANEHNRVKLVFTQSAVQPAAGIAWDIAASVTSNDGQITYDTQQGQAVFGPSGVLTSSTLPTMNNDGTPVTVDLGSTYGGIISSSGTVISASSHSDGTLGGTLTKYAINQDGIIIADFSNGRQSAIGRVAVYHFQNDQGLNRDGGTHFAETSNSGKPLFWTDAAGNAATGAAVRSGMLEASNIRMEAGLTDMIILQRAYQANAKTITAADEMIQKALQMHR